MSHEIDRLVGRQIRLRRTKLSMSQTELATRVGVTFQQIQKYEKGFNRVSCSRLFEIAKALEAPITFFFTGLPETNAGLVIAGPFDADEAQEGRRLFDAFRQIKGHNTRKVLVSFIEAFAASQDDAT